MKFFLLTTDHRNDRLLFQDDEDFQVAMNYVAVAACVLNINVLAFILMSNHVHFVLQSTRSEAKEFIDKFKQLYGHHYYKKYNVRGSLRRLGVDIKELYIEDGSLHRGIAYTQMNCVAANITPSPLVYPWGTGDIFFNASSTEGTKLGFLSGREQSRALKSNVKLPGNYILCSKGYVLPKCYVPFRFVESLFRSPSRYSYFLKNSSKARLHTEKEAAPSFRDQIVRQAMTDLILSLFRETSINNLNQEQKAELMRQMHRRFSCDVKQLARTSGLPLTEVEELINGFY